MLLLPDWAELSGLQSINHLEPLDSSHGLMSYCIKRREVGRDLHVPVAKHEPGPRRRA
jgi:hypothetical protein